VIKCTDTLLKIALNADLNSKDKEKAIKGPATKVRRKFHSKGKWSWTDRAYAAKEPRMG
jgi:hypothetical protein